MAFNAGLIFDTRLKRLKHLPSNTEEFNFVSISQTWYIGKQKFVSFVQDQFNNLHMLRFLIDPDGNRKEIMSLRNYSEE